MFPATIIANPTTTLNGMEWTKSIVLLGTKDLEYDTWRNQKSIVCFIQKEKRSIGYQGCALADCALIFFHNLGFI